MCTDITNQAGFLVFARLAELAGEKRIFEGASLMLISQRASDMPGSALLSYARYRKVGDPSASRHCR